MQRLAYDLGPKIAGPGIKKTKKMNSEQDLQNIVAFLKGNNLPLRHYIFGTQAELHQQFTWLFNPSGTPWPDDEGSTLATMPHFTYGGVYFQLIYLDKIAEPKTQTA